VYVSDLWQGESGVHAIEIDFDIRTDVSKVAQSNFRKYSILPHNRQQFVSVPACRKVR
jgi:hypothetical protein